MIPVESFNAWIWSIVFVGGLLFTHSVRYTPQWVARDFQLRDRWDNTNLSAFFIALFTSAIASILYASENSDYTALATVIVGMITFCAIQSFDSDFAVRRADRHPLNYTIFTLLVLGFTFEFMYKEETKNWISIVLFLCVLIAMLRLRGFGDSDHRALWIAFLSASFLFDISFVQFVLIGFLAFVFVYAIIQAILHKNVKSFVRKMSIPAVPLLLLPTVLVLMGAPVLI